MKSRVTALERKAGATCPECDVPKQVEMIEVYEDELPPSSEGSTERPLCPICGREQHISFIEVVMGKTRPAEEVRGEK